MYDPKDVEGDLRALPFICKAIRICKSLNQRQLADLVGVKQATVSRWEKGLSTPDILSFLRIMALKDEVAQGFERALAERRKLEAEKATL